MNTEDVITNVRRYLGDAAISETDYINKVSILAYVRVLIGDSVEPYRWDDITLNGYIAEGIQNVIAFRTDCASATEETMPKRFADAVAQYASYKAYASEAEDQSDTARRDFHLSQYNGLLISTPYRWNDSVLEAFIESGVREIRRGRPDVMFEPDVTGDIDLPDYLEISLMYYVLMKCYTIRYEYKTDNAKHAHFRELFMMETFGSIKR